MLYEVITPPCRKALEKAGLKVADISDVLLVGGQTRMPLVQQAVKKFFGREPNKGVNPDEVVVLVKNKVHGKGAGRSKKEAEQAAAREALAKIG